MLKKCAILGLVLLILGGVAFGWLRREMLGEQQSGPEASASSLETVPLESYGRWYELSPEEQNQLLLEVDKDRQNKTPEDLLAEQKARLRADLDRLASGDLRPGGLANYLYGPDWQEEVVLHSERKEQQQITQTASIVCLSIGGTLFGSCSLIWVFASIGQGLKRRRARKVPDDEPEDSTASELTDISHDDEAEDQELDEGGDETVGSQRPLSTELDCFSGSSDHARSDADCDEGDTTDDGADSPPPPNRRRKISLDLSAEEDDSLTAVLLSDAPSTETEWSAMSEWTSRADGDSYSHDSMAGTETMVQHTARVFDPYETEAEPNPLQDQADVLQEQIAEFKEMAQSVQQATREQSAPLNNTLKELAQQVSAIRDYAASQQDRVEKLQDGYDWNIIRTFCLRVIRCLDNIENRINKLSDDDNVSTHLEEVRDELLFALESSGIEQYRPEVESDYRGQEKLAETIRDKEPSEKPEQVGKIAKVVRPGYRYMIDEESAKIVRTAQVKLYG